MIFPPQKGALSLLLLFFSPKNGKSKALTWCVRRAKRRQFNTEVAMPEPRIIKRYQNRKLYDTEASAYVTLDDIAGMIKDGLDLRVIDNKSKKDLTSLTLTQIVFEEEKKHKSILPLAALRRIIASGGESISEFVDRHLVPGLNSFTHARREMDRYVNRLVKKGRLDPEEGRHLVQDLMTGGQKGIEEAYSRVDARVAEVLELLRSVATLSKEVARLEDRVEELEAELAAFKKRK
jgi:polyhydroxyalkanoate synthesis repressor PhaR